MSLSGKMNFLGGWQLALLTARQAKRPHARSGHRLRLPPWPSDGLPWRGLDRSGPVATMRKGEQGMCLTLTVASGTLGGGGEVEAIGSQLGRFFL